MVLKRLQALQLQALLATAIRHVIGTGRLIACLGQGIASQLPADRAVMTAEPTANLAKRFPLASQAGYLDSLIHIELTVVFSHRTTLLWQCTWL
jgi:hypothetical protein